VECKTLDKFPQRLVEGVDNSKVLFEFFSMMFGVDFTIKSVACDDITPEVVSMVVEGGDVGMT
jgi:hypothetical protein